MNWLGPQEVLRLAGYPAETPEAGSEKARAISFAEQQIEAATDAVWGASVDFTKRFTLQAKQMHLETPLDARSIREVAPLPSGHNVALTEGGLALTFGGFATPWQPGQYLVRGTRGYTVIPDAVTKAASLLAAYYLELSDPDRSRYSGLSVGDFGGTMRLSDLPVPEAAALLRRYKRRVRVG